MRCPTCENENPDDSQFCNSCGSELEARCPECERQNPAGSRFCNSCGSPLSGPQLAPTAPSTVEAPDTAQPTSFDDGRYRVKELLGEGGKKRVYLTHDGVLDREVALAVIKTEGLDEASRSRITREAQAMAHLGDHPNILQIHDLGEEGGQPYMVMPLMPGGDVEVAIDEATDHRLPLEQVIAICKQVCRGLEHAHSEGIVHRDLKPGNVWLAADGTAKIGDFGLAVATDRSRLTQEGMMVGTVSYMPPEQAMGGEVDGRSDLYSLGAMLYEMVTGRPPFVGDETVAIIGQHLNTPPVAPTWHNPEVPPGLEALILRLLEKDPGSRPASAEEVREALESINVGAPIGSGAPTEPSTDQAPLYRTTFVGREAEVRQLHTAFDGAMSGEGSLMMVVGEPGIGKTSLCEQLGTYVTLRGGTTLVGHCYEEGSLSLPYLAFVEAMRSYVLAREPEDLKKELGSGASDVARIVSEIRDRVEVEPSEPTDPEQDRYRLLQAGGLLPEQRRGGAADTDRPGGPARCRQGHPGLAEARGPQPLGLPADDRGHLPGRRGRPDARAVRGPGRAAQGVQLWAHPAAGPHRRRGAANDEQHRRPGGALGYLRGGAPADRGQPPLRTGGTWEARPALRQRSRPAFGQRRTCGRPS